MCVMGTGPQLVHLQIQQVLQQQPEVVTWGEVKDVTVRRNPDNSLGIRVETFQGKKETFTVVTKVKESCHLLQGILNVFDRVIYVNGTCITEASKNDVKRVLTSSTSTGPFLKLTARSLSSYKLVTRDGPVLDDKPSVVPLSPTSSALRTLNSPFQVERLCVELSEERISSGGQSLKDASPPISRHFTDSTIDTILPPEDDDGSLSTSMRSHTASKGKIENSCAGNRNPDISLRTTDQVLLKKKREKRMQGFSSEVCSSDSEHVSSRSLLDKENIQADLTSQAKTKRGISQVSDGSSSKSFCDSASSSEGSVTMGKSKGENSKTSKRFYHPTPSAGNQDMDELMPLKPVDGHDHQHLGEGKYPYRLTPVRDMDRLLPDPAVSMQDIFILEEQPSPCNSLPASGHSSSTSMCLCASCSVQSRKCKSCVKPATSGHKKKVGAPRVSPLTIPDTLSESGASSDMGTFFVKNPHMVKWDQTKVVTIEKNSSSEKFGFNYKVKVGKNADGSVEIYTLVESVTSGGPAETKLHVGDWIRSINSVPIQNPVNAFKLLSNSADETSVRLVIQRPIGISPQANSESSSPSLSGDTDKCDSGVPPHDITQLPWVVTDSNRVGDSSSHGQESVTAKQTRPLPGNDPYSPVTNLFNIPTTPECSENVFVSSSSNNSGLPRAVKLPKVGMFICGSQAANCASLILKNSDVNIDTQALQKVGYTNVECSMTLNSSGGLVVSDPTLKSYSTSVDQSNSILSAISQSEGRTEDERCVSCGCEIPLESSQSLSGSVINVQMFVVPDDRFFHNCCNCLFTKSTIFILTFDGAKLLRSSAGEIARLQNLSHTIRSFVEYDCNIVLSGLLDGDIPDRSLADEVSTLFFTSYGHQLRKYNVIGPELIHLEPSKDMDGFHHLQTVIWKSISDTVQRHHILHPGLLVLDYLSELRRRELFLTEAKLMECIRNLLPRYGQDVHQIILTELLSLGEIISGKAAPISHPHLHKIEPLVMINPSVLLDHLFWLITMPPKSLQSADDKQKWVKVFSSGMISAPDFEDLCVGSEVCSQYIADFMEGYGLLFRKPGTSANQSVEYYIPYFAQEPCSLETPREDKKDPVLYLQFKGHAATQTYFSLLFNTVSQCDSPSSFVTPANNCSTFSHRGFSCLAFHQKLEDRVKFLFKIEDKSSILPLCELYAWLLDIAMKTFQGTDTSFSLGPPCPLGDKCQTNPTPGLHLLDLQEVGPIMCDSVRVDAHKSIKRWLIPEQPQVKAPMVYVTDLPWSTFSKVCNKLRICSTFGRDWKGLAGLMGYDVETVTLYEVQRNPSEALLVDWSRSQNGTLEELIKLLADPEMSRDDIITDIKQGMAQN